MEIQTRSEHPMQSGAQNFFLLSIGKQGCSIISAAPFLTSSAKTAVALGDSFPARPITVHFEAGL